MTEQHLAVREAASLPSPGEWQTMVEMAGVLIKGGLLPQTIKTPEAALTVMLKGRELRIPPLHALSNIVVIQGKPVCNAELMLALVYRDHGDLAVIVEESTAEVCRVSYRRRAWDRARPFAFTIADARTAGLAGKGTWAQYPQAMLRARCISAVARLAFPDSIGGMHTPEELGAVVRVTDDGAVEVAALSDEPDPGPSPKAAATRALLEAATAEGEVVARERPGPHGSTIVREGVVDVVFGYGHDEQPEPAPPAVPGDDVDQLSGEALADACRRLDVLLKASGVPTASYPKKPASAADWRAWWRTGQATLAASARPVAAS